MKSISIISLFIVLLSYFSKAEVIKFNDLNFDNQVNYFKYRNLKILMCQFFFFNEKISIII